MAAAVAAARSGGSSPQIRFELVVGRIVVVVEGIGPPV